MSKKKTNTRKLKVHERNGLIFKTLDDLRLYLELLERRDSGDITDFDIGNLTVNMKGKSKYGSKRLMVDDHLFHSKLEVRYLFLLKDLMKTGEVTGYELGPKFELQEKFSKNGVNHRSINYFADFEVSYNDGRVEIVDTKGKVTPEFSMKRKMFEFKFPDLDLKILKFVPSYGGWIEYDDWRKQSSARRRALKKERKLKKGNE